MGSSNEPPVTAAREVPRWRGHSAWAPMRKRLEARLAAAGQRPGAIGISTARVPLLTTVAIFALAFLLPAWPWLSGAVTIPWDAKSQFFPPVQFLASSLARGEWPWWSPNVFGGWPEISDPQSLLFSPLHVVLAALDPAI